jgi:predicted FMN-binding regulatory protein PaiB
MHIKEEFDLEDIETARTIVRAHPFATIVTADLRATHMPCLVDDDADGLAILSHVACADPASRSLDGPLLMIFHARTATCRRAGTRATRSRPGTT